MSTIDFNSERHFYYADTCHKSDSVEPEPVKLNPNMAWRLRRKMEALSDYECDVCGGPCGKHDIIELDSGVYYVCCGECADEAVEEY
jgi:hypothetical protein